MNSFVDEPKQIKLMVNVKGSFVYVGLDEQGTLRLSKSSESGMCNGE